MALSALYLDSTEPLNCRACHATDTALSHRNLVHIFGSTGTFKQTRIEVLCEQCRSLSVYWFGGEGVMVDEGPRAGNHGRIASQHHKLATWFPRLQPWFAWLNG